MSQQNISIECFLRDIQQQAWNIKTSTNPGSDSIHQLRRRADKLPGDAHPTHKAMLDELLREMDISLDSATRFSEPELLRNPEVFLENHFDSRNSTHNNCYGMIHGGSLYLDDSDGRHHYRINCSRFHHVTLIKKVVTRPFSYGEVLTRTALDLSVTKYSTDSSDSVMIHPDEKTESFYPAEVSENFYSSTGMKNYNDHVEEGQIGHSYSQFVGRIPHRHCCALILTPPMLSQIEYLRTKSKEKTERARRVRYELPDDGKEWAIEPDVAEAFNPYFKPSMEAKGEGVIFQSPYLKIISFDSRTRPVIVSYLAGYKKTSSQQSGHTRILRPKLFFLK